MIRKINVTNNAVENNKVLNYAEIYGLSTDSKPTDGLITGSLFIEVDTGDIYLFNEAETTWVKQCSLQE